MPSAPAISVLLPVRNARPFLASTLRSLARQTLARFEVIAVDDGSTDGSGEVLERCARRDSRFVVVRGPHEGLPATLNAALARARAPVVARMDADDLVHARRLELQLCYLARHPEAAAVGSRVRLFPAGSYGAGMERWVTWHNALLSHEDMAREILIDSPLVHGTAAIRRNWLERIGGWTSQPWPEDLDLWIRMLEAGARLAKLPDVLYAWRQHPHSATRQDARYRRRMFDALKLDALTRGFLAGPRSPTLVGVGSSLDRWQSLLGARWPGVRRLEAPGPTRGLLPALVPPMVMVFGAYQRRDVWRRFMTEAGMIEGKSFIFVA